MAGELEPMPLADILGGIGYKTAMGDWPPGFDVAHALLTLVHLTEKMRHCIVAHHDADKERLGPLFDITVDSPCAICMAAQDATPDDVLTNLKVPDAPPTPHGWPAPEDNELHGNEWCGVRAARDFACTRPAGHTGLHFSTDGGWG